MPGFRGHRRTGRRARARDYHHNDNHHGPASYQPADRRHLTRTCFSTRTTRSTGTRGATRRSPRRNARTSRSSSRSATRPATGATSWSARASRTTTSPAILNEHFVSHQGRPRGASRPRRDLHDGDACSTTSGQGGWPMSVFLTPDRKPFFAGTYFPPESRWGRPGFKRGADAGRASGERIATRVASVTGSPDRRGQARMPSSSRAKICIPHEVVARDRGDPRPGVRPAEGRNERRRNEQVSAVDGHGHHAAGLPALAEAHGRRQAATRGAAGVGEFDARPHGPRRHLRPARRRQSPATAPTPTGSFRTSRKCSTTRHWLRAST